MLFTQIDPPRLWVGVAKWPGLTMTIEHVIESSDPGTLLTERATLSGALAGLAASVLGKRLESACRETTAHCARLAGACQ